MSVKNVLNIVYIAVLLNRKYIRVMNPGISERGGGGRCYKCFGIVFNSLFIYRVSLM